MQESDTIQETDGVTDETSVDDTQADDTDAEPEGADQLADAGKRALDTMKAQRNAERQKRRDLEARLAELEKPKDGGPEAAALQATAKAAIAKANERILRSEIKAAAKGVLADPADAFKFLDLSDLEVSDDGEVDEAEIAEKIAALVASKPYLAAQSGKRFQGTSDSGPRNGGAGSKSQLSEADMASMSPSQIDAARREGRFDSLLGKS